MELSEAIRLGAMLHRQTFRQVERRSGMDVIATCALGAAKQAGYPVHLAWQSPRMSPQPCVVIGCRYGRRRLSIASWIAHFNDLHRWTREQIADWVEEQEMAGRARLLGTDASLASEAEARPPCEVTA